MEFETIFARIDKMREALRHDFGPDAESSIAEIDRDLKPQIQKDPMLVLRGRSLLQSQHQAPASADRHRATVAEQWRRGKSTRARPPALGQPLDRLFCDANLRPGEKLVELPDSRSSRIAARTRARRSKPPAGCRSKLPSPIRRSFANDAKCAKPKRD